MRLNEYIIITCGNTTEVFIGSKAEEEAHEAFMAIMEEAFEYYHNTGTIYLGYDPNNTVTVDGLRANSMDIFKAIANKFGYLDFYSLHLDVYAKGSYCKDV